MKHKLLTVLLTLIATLCLALVGCGGTGVAVVDDGGTEQDGGSQKPDGGNQGEGGGSQGEGTVPSAKEYTVTYDANGGEFSDGKSTKSVTVEENKKLSVPEKPSRDQYIFVHWCTDSSLSTEWKFDEDVVTKATTLYAKWEKVAVEYNVTFVLNYAGAQNVVKSYILGCITNRRSDVWKK